MKTEQNCGLILAQSDRSIEKQEQPHETKNEPAKQARMPGETNEVALAAHPMRRDAFGQNASWCTLTAASSEADTAQPPMMSQQRRSRVI
jgi:hypothetical protein